MRQVGGSGLGRLLYAFPVVSSKLRGMQEQAWVILQALGQVQLSGSGVRSFLDWATARVSEGL